MIGREAYARPWMFATADSEIYGEEDQGLSRAEILEKYIRYCEETTEETTPWMFVRPLLNFFVGLKGNKDFRRLLNEEVNVKKNKNVRDILYTSIAPIPASDLALGPDPSSSSSSSSAEEPHDPL